MTIFADRSQEMKLVIDQKWMVRNDNLQTLKPKWDWKA